MEQGAPRHARHDTMRTEIKGIGSRGPLPKFGSVTDATSVWQAQSAMGGHSHAVSSIVVCKVVRRCR